MLPHTTFRIDHHPADVALTDWKRLARRRQAAWRIAHGHPIGSHPHGEPPPPNAALVGNRLDLTYARVTGANFLTPAVLAAVHDRLAQPEAHELIDEPRLWADLLSSMPLCFNLFGDLAADPATARDAVDRWFPGTPPGPIAVRFEHSPGRCDPAFLGNKSAFDVAIEVATSESSRAVIGVETKYHEHAALQPPPKPSALARYESVVAEAGVFVDDWRVHVLGTDLQQIWLDHLLLLSMLQHPSGRWKSGRFVLVYPAENPSITSVAARYRAVLRDGATFDACTLESLLDTQGALSPATVALLRGRYL